MKEVSKLLIRDFRIKELGYDFMGFSLNKNTLSFHHLIFSKEYCKKMKLGTGYWYFNGVILCQETSHDYLHLIQRYGDDELFRYITSEMIDMKIKGYLDIKNLINIGQILDYFEYQHIEEKDDKGRYIIKEKYLERKKFELG